MGDLLDPRTWANEGQVSDEQLERIVARVTAAIPAPPPPPSPWTPTAVGVLATTILTGLAGMVATISQTRSSGDETREVIRTALDEHARVEARARDEITERLGSAESQIRWTAGGLCRVNGRPLHEDQPCALVVTEQDQNQTGRGVRVSEAYPR